MRIAAFAENQHPARIRACAHFAPAFALAFALALAALFSPFHFAWGQAIDKPKVMVVIEEKVAGVFGTTGWENVGQAESTLASRLIAAGFPVVDSQTVRRNIPRDKALRILEGDEKAAALAGLQFGAQIIVTGTAISKNTGGRLMGTSMQSVQATVSARAVRSDDARIIFTQTATGSKAHIDEVQGGALAIEQASQELAESLVAALVRETLNRHTEGNVQEITLMISGLVSYRHLAFVQQFLESGVQGVAAVHMRQFANGNAELAVDYAGKSSFIAAQLASQKFTGFRLEPTSVTPNKLDVRAILER